MNVGGVCCAFTHIHLLFYVLLVLGWVFFFFFFWAGGKVFRVFLPPPAFFQNNLDVLCAFLFRVTMQFVFI